jgi:predicted PurR-regulated permease PerM
LRTYDGLLTAGRTLVSYTYQVVVVPVVCFLADVPGIKSAIRRLVPPSSGPVSLASATRPRAAGRLDHRRRGRHGRYAGDGRGQRGVLAFTIVNRLFEDYVLSPRIRKRRVDVMLAVTIIAVPAAAASQL